MRQLSDRKIWQTPWGYSESIVVTGGIIFIGFILQLTTGSFNFFLLSNPVNIITGLVLFGISLLLAHPFKKSSFSRWVSSVEMSVTLIASILLLTIIMGLTPQVGIGATSKMALGFDSMTSNWSFVLLYAFTLLSLGVTIQRHLSHLRLKRDIPFILLHAGLWLLLAASGLGYADMERYVMYVEEGETQWRVYDDDGNVKELPIAIKLNDFDMEVYEPRLVIIDRTSGEAQPIGKPQYYQIDLDNLDGSIAGWDICVEEYIHKAVRNSDSTYREVPMPGATPAAKVTATRGDNIFSGWVCGGSRLQAYMSLPLDENHSIVMTPADPRRYLSDVEVYTEQGDALAATIEVNSPLMISSWAIYQYGYDNAAGDLSTYSSFELVYDPWLLPVYVGILLMMLGAVAMVLLGRKRSHRV
ncbi:MAG: cytochrome c biogenesis protein ResB [Rikenellaceae bacterium]